MEQNAPRASLIASLTAPPSAQDLAAIPAAVEWLEVRADLTGDLDAAALRRASGKKLLYTLRSSAEGGASESAPARRRQRLLTAAAADYDRIDLEGARDLTPEILAAVPPERRLVSWHGPATDLAGLESRFAEIARVPAALYKLVPAATQPGDELAPLLFLAQLGRRDVAAFASGPAGVWTRLIAPRLGAPVVYGSAGNVPASPGQPTMAQLVLDYGLPELPAVERLYGIVGNPVARSLSPRLHNAAYRALGIPALFLPFHAESFGDFWLEVVEGVGLDNLGLPLVGLAVTAPFKEAALAVAAAASPLVEHVGAANTLLRRGELWEAENTDPEGVVAPLAARGVPVAGLRAVVIGAGGAGRAAAVGLANAGARVTVSNRDRERGLSVAHELGLPFVPLAELDASAYGLLVNATSLGREDGEPGPVSAATLPPGAVIVDLVYGRQPTLLAREARARGLVVVDGLEVLLAQAIPQFRILTGAELPLEVGRRAVGLEAG